jgi:uncharacterized membrane protein
MSDRGTDGSAFDRARETLSLIGARAKNRQNQLFTLLRFSNGRPVGIDRSNQGVDSAEIGESVLNQFADLNGELVDSLFDQRIEDVKGRLAVSNLSIGLSDSLSSVAELVGERENENAIVYVVSDFREKDWGNPADIDNKLNELHTAGAAIEMINCVKTAEANLSLTELEAEGNVRVAGTPLMMKVTVKNCSESVAEKVQIQLGSLAFPEPTSATVPEEVQPEFLEIPTVFIQSIAPGESQSRSFPVYFNTTGDHVVFASLPDDAVAADNERFSVTGFSNTAKVLLVDDQEQSHSAFMALAISPGGMTGIEPEFRTKDFLRDASAEVLNPFDVIFLMDVDTLDEAAVRNLENFVSDGGGLAVFAGPKSNLSFYNTSLYRNGEGVLPMPFGKVVDVPEQLEDRVPDIAPESHPIFAPVLGGKNSLLGLVQVKKIIQPPIEWSANDDSQTTVLATVRGLDGWPLVVDRSFGKGRVVLFTTTAGPVWNNWMRNATFPPIMLLMQNYLAEGKYQLDQKLVGETIDVNVASSDFTPNLTVLAPGGSDGARLVSKVKMKVSAADSDQLVTTIGKLLPSESVRETDLPGIYDIWMRRTDSGQEVKRLSLNVDTAESEMALANRQQLLVDLAKSNPSLVDWDGFNPEPKQKPASSLSKLLLMLLAVVLIAEQLLAYSTSYHRK